MTIVALDLNQFSELVYQFIQRGVKFKAFGDTLTIEFTGGF